SASGALTRAALPEGRPSLSAVAAETRASVPGSAAPANPATSNSRGCRPRAGSGRPTKTRCSAAYAAVSSTPPGLDSASAPQSVRYSVGTPTTAVSRPSTTSRAASTASTSATSGRAATAARTSSDSGSAAATYRSASGGRAVRSVREAASGESASSTGAPAPGAGRPGAGSARAGEDTDRARAVPVTTRGTRRGASPPRPPRPGDFLRPRATAIAESSFFLVDRGAPGRRPCAPRKGRRKRSGEKANTVLGKAAPPPGRT